MQQNNRNEEKGRKSEAQKKFEEADNAGRFAGNDADAEQARAQAEENIRQDTHHQRQGKMNDNQILDADDVKPGQTNMLEEEAQNINKNRDGGDLANNDSSLEHARNKATQGIQEGRDTGTSDDRSRNSGTR